MVKTLLLKAKDSGIAQPNLEAEKKIKRRERKQPLDASLQDFFTETRER